MYNPPANRVHHDDEAFEIVDAAALGHLVSVGPDGFVATSLPLLVDRVERRLRGHLARANDHWTTLDGAEVLVVFSPSDGYVSPAWYPSKAETDGRVVPTWNYEVVHVRGVAHVHDDATWLRALVDDLTVRHESARTDGGEPWSVDDAPPEFVDRQLRAIVGLSIEIAAIEGKRKLSQNRSDADRQGVIDGLGRSDDPSAVGLAATMRRTI